MENPNEILCYDKYRLGRVEGKFNLDMKKLVSEGTPMTREVVNNYNNVTNQSGIIYVLNVNKTEEFKEYERERKASKIANKFKVKNDAEKLLKETFSTVLKDKIKDDEKGNAIDPTLKEMKIKCEEMNYVKSEWQQLNKAELIEYLKTKEV